MSIRIRKVNGRKVALCAAETDAQFGDIYLDDEDHHALGVKFQQDFYTMGFMDRNSSDEETLKIMESQKLRDAEEEIKMWTNQQEIVNLTKRIEWLEEKVGGSYLDSYE